MINIRSALPKDAEDILRIARQVQLPSNPSPSISKRGFLVFVKSLTEYKKALSNSSNNYVALDNDKVIGYVLAYDRSALERLHKDQDVETKLIFKLLSPSSPIYIDQIAINPAYQGQHLAQQLLDNIVVRNPLQSITAAIVEKPLPNLRSLHFFVNRNRWSRIGEVSRDNLVAGIYSSIFN